MWRLLKITFICFLCETHPLESSLKVSLENFKFTYFNKEFIELNATTVAVSKNTKKIRSSVTFKNEVTENLQLQVDVYRITKTNKKYLIIRTNRPVRELMHLSETELATSDFRSHCIPDFYWPIKPNVTYTLRDWWLKHSQCPFEVATGRFNAISTTKYPNNTILSIIDISVNIFNSAESFE